LADDEESRTVSKTPRARFSDFRSDSDLTIGVQNSDLSRDCGIGMTTQAELSLRLLGPTWGNHEDCTYAPRMTALARFRGWSISYPFFRPV